MKCEYLILLLVIVLLLLTLFSSIRKESYETDLFDRTNPIFETTVNGYKVIFAFENPDQYGGLQGTFTILKPDGGQYTQRKFAYRFDYDRWVINFIDRLPDLPWQPDWRGATLWLTRVNPYVVVIDQMPPGSLRLERRMGKDGACNEILTSTPGGRGEKGQIVRFQNNSGMPVLLYQVNYDGVHGFITEIAAGKSISLTQEFDSHVYVIKLGTETDNMCYRVIRNPISKATSTTTNNRGRTVYINSFV